jgi:adenylyltransferase/sulfurtransferase
MGVLQALEAIKVITAPDVDVLNQTPRQDPPALHIFSAYSNPLFRTIRLRSRRINCAVCSASATVSLDTIKSGSTDYIFFCGSASLPSLLAPEERLSPQEYRKLHPQSIHGEPEQSSSRPHTIIDVRDQAQFGICNLENSVNIPISNILASIPAPTPPVIQGGDSGSQLPSWLPLGLANSDSNDPIYVVCRLGNDSQIAVKKLKDLGLDRGGQRFIGDIRGGFRAWREQIDPGWPEY